MGYLGAAAPKRRFGHFFAAEKVTRARGRETSPSLGMAKRKGGGWNRTLLPEETRNNAAGRGIRPALFIPVVDPILPAYQYKHPRRPADLG